MKTKLILASMLALAMLAGCKKEPGTTVSGGSHDMAYISVVVKTPSATGTRAGSAETNASAEEAAIKTLYAVTYDANNNLVHYKDKDPAQAITGFDTDGASTTQKSKAFCIPSTAKKLLLVANPGTKLKDALDAAAKGDSFDVLNAAIADVTNVAELGSDADGYAMINQGMSVAADTNDDDAADLCLIDISGKISLIGDGAGQFKTELLAQANAEDDNNRIGVKIERLAAKIVFSSGITDATPGEKVLPANTAIFTFGGWALDVINTTYYPWAKKVDLASSPATTVFYSKNFYTIDPNYDNETGLKYCHVDPATYANDAAFLTADAMVYCLENTMRAGEQKFKNATRVVLRGAYYPDQAWTDDWFSYNGVNYQDFAAIQAAYGLTSAGPKFKDACERFYTAIADYADAQDPKITLTGNDFASLTTEDLEKIPNGGELVKEDDCVRWYQDGLCYYWYEIRHDDAVTADMGFGKYGIVRNNWYALTLSKINGPGKPWYPGVDPKDPGGDVDPEDPIDETAGYIGVTVEIGPWVKWDHSVEV